MEPVSRRTFFKQAGVTAAAVGAVAAVPGGIASASTRLQGTHAAPEHAEPELTHEEQLEGGMVVHVRDAARGEIAIYVGEREVNIRDSRLAARLVRAAR